MVNGSKDYYGAGYWLRAAMALNSTSACYVMKTGYISSNLVSNDVSIAASFCFNLG